jgi:hypothetical protein
MDHVQHNYSASKIPQNNTILQSSTVLIVNAIV